MRITVSGLPGSGTTSLARYLSEKYNFGLISAGEIFRQMAKEHNMDLPQFGALAESDPSFDRMIDERQKEIAESRDNIIVEGRLSGWMVPSADLKIWINAPLGCRVRRIQSRDEVINEETAKHTTKDREQCEALRYRMYYQIDISDLGLYHMILNSEHWGIEQLGAIVDTAIAVTKK
ncbi:MAG: AAA family ATPase [Methanomicrobiales archaeon]|nr:AAA family ATPase [Methanomicrobiales archaeon]